MENLPKDHFVTSQQFTPKAYTDVYPAIDPTSSALSQAGKVVIITGASKGIGKGIAESFAHAKPAALILLARSEGPLKAAADAIRGISPSTNVVAIPTDITSESSVAAAFSSIKSQFSSSPPTVLVNNAGAFTMGPVRGADAPSWWNNIQTNGLGTFLVTKAFLELQGEEKLATRDAAHPITVVTMTSALGIMTMPGMSGYSLSKALVQGITDFVVAENPAVTAVNLHPGIVKTELVAPMMQPFANDTPALVGGSVVWLASGDKTWLSGRYLHSNWDVEGLEARKDEILKDDLLKVKFNSRLGKDQF